MAKNTMMNLSDGGFSDVLCCHDYVERLVYSFDNQIQSY